MVTRYSGVKFTTSTNLVQHSSGTEFNRFQVQQLICRITTDKLVMDTNCEIVTKYILKDLCRFIFYLFF